MGKKIIFLREDCENVPVGLSKNVEYSYIKGRLKIKWGKKNSYEGEAKVGEAYIVGTNPNKIFFALLKLPRSNNDLLMLLLGFPKENRAYTEEEHKIIADEERKRRDWWGYEEITVKTKKSIAVRCNHFDDNYRPISVYLKDNLNKEDYLQILQKNAEYIDYPKWWVENILYERFNFSVEEVRSIGLE